MNLIFKFSEKELLRKRNEIFLNDIEPIILEKKFQKSPFSGDWYGKNNLGDFTYSFSRINNIHLEMLTIHINKGDTFIKFFLNIFILNPLPNSLSELFNKDGIKLQLKPLNSTSIRLVSFGSNCFFPQEYKIGKYFTQSGFEMEVEKLTKLLIKDMNNFELFISNWHKMQTPYKVSWNLEII